MGRLEPRHAHALEHVLEAEDFLITWHRPPAAFELYPRGGTRHSVLHPGWNSCWAVPDTLTLDDLSELGLLDVQRVSEDGRRFTLTETGRARARGLSDRSTPGGAG